MSRERAFSIAMGAAFLALAVFVAVVLGRRGAHQAEPAAPPTVPRPSAVEPTKPPPIATREQWEAAVQATFREIGAKTDEGGIKEFAACFDGASGPKCAGTDKMLSARYDAFRKLRHFKGPQGSLWAYAATIFVHESVVAAYVALPSCDAPTLFLRPVFAGRGWLFMNRIAFMAGHDVVLDKKVDNPARETEGGRLYEEGHVALTDSEAESLQKLIGKPIIIRLTGTKGFFTVSKKMTEAFMLDLPAVLNGYRTLREASAKHANAVCN
jgi:hypothetical protein